MTSIKTQYKLFRRAIKLCKAEDHSLEHIRTMIAALAPTVLAPYTNKMCEEKISPRTPARQLKSILNYYQSVAANQTSRYMRNTYQYRNQIVEIEMTQVNGTKHITVKRITL